MMLGAVTDSADAAAVQRGWHRGKDPPLKLCELLTGLKKHIPVPMSVYIRSSCTSVAPVNTQARKLPDQRAHFTVACSCGLYHKYSDTWIFFVGLTSKSCSWDLLTTRVMRFH